MLKLRLFCLAIASVACVSPVHAATFADAVISYTPGTGQKLLTNTAAILGEPSRKDAYGYGVDSFDPPYSRDQILSVGNGGSVVVKFDTPVLNHPTNPYGADFIVFGHAGLTITNDYDSDWNPIGIPATDGTFFQRNTGTSRVSVSRDGVTFYTLNPALAPTVDTYYPTEGSGSFNVPVSPAISSNDFVGITLDGIRALYAGSAGGASYDISWAQDSKGNAVFLPDISYVRIDETGGVAQIDGIAAVFTNDVTVVSADFSHDPLAAGWQAFGNTNLFKWNAASQALDATWDSSQPNSYFFHPLGTILGKDDDFLLSFDLNLTYVDTQRANSFEFAIGLHNHSNATNANFLRGTGNSTNLAEFTYFPNNTADWGATIWGAFFSTNGNLSSSSSTDYTIMELPVNTLMHVTMTYTASNRTTALSITTNGVSIGSLNSEVLSTRFTDYRVDTLSISSYSDAGQDPAWYGSVFAQGQLKNLSLVCSPAPIRNQQLRVTNALCNATFTGHTNWTYMLEQTSDFKSWSPASDPVSGTNGPITLQQANPGITNMQFFRINAKR